MISFDVLTEAFNGQTKLLGFGMQSYFCILFENSKLHVRKYHFLHFSTKDSSKFGSNVAI